MSFTDGKPFIATEKDLQTKWGGAKAVARNDGEIRPLSEATCLNRVRRT